MKLNLGSDLRTDVNASVSSSYEFGARQPAEVHAEAPGTEQWRVLIKHLWDRLLALPLFIHALILI